MMSYPELRYATPPEWVARIEERPLELLSDHAHNELKAAATAQAWLLKNTDKPRLVLELSKLASEEVEHFDRVIRLLYSRGGELQPIDNNPYAAELLSRSAGTRKDPFVDRLLVAALIEARSCERFVLLGEYLRDPVLRQLYRDLTPCEMEHKDLFVDLVRESLPAGEADSRIAQLFDLEGQVVAELPFAYRMHSGIN